MRPLLLADLIAAARWLALVPENQRAAAVQNLFQQACIADKVAKRLHRPHIPWHNGSLMAASAGRAKTCEAFLSDPDYADALLQLIQFQKNRLTAHRKRKSVLSVGRLPETNI